MFAVNHVGQFIKLLVRQSVDKRLLVVIGRIVLSTDICTTLENYQLKEKKMKGSIVTYPGIGVVNHARQKCSFVLQVTDT